jgi:hypothetical protein
VFDDCAKPKYKDDPRVYFVPGHPVLRDAMPALMSGLGVSAAGKAVMKLEEFERRTVHTLQYGSRRRRFATVAKPLLAASLALAGIVVLKTLIEGDHATNA